MTSELNLDLLRSVRIGLPEAVLCAGKSAAQLRAIVAQLIEQKKSMLFTRVDDDAHRIVSEAAGGALPIDDDRTSRTTYVGAAPAPHAMTRVAVVTAGSSDVPVAKEAVRTLQWHGENALEMYDVGVAGLWRLVERVPELQTMRVVICVAGMDAALPSVVGGLVPGVVIAVPTSTGYGVARSGETALHAALCACSSGVVVTNIDNGYGAACAAIRALGAAKKP
jgi:pyridinium-3,5-biscarboxylic acid mononucleotide synthase